MLHKLSPLISITKNISSVVVYKRENYLHTPFLDRIFQLISLVNASSVYIIFNYNRYFYDWGMVCSCFFASYSWTLIFLYLRFCTRLLIFTFHSNLSEICRAHFEVVHFLQQPKTNFIMFSPINQEPKFLGRWLLIRFKFLMLCATNQIRWVIANRRARVIVNLNSSRARLPTSCISNKSCVNKYKA